MNRSVLSLIKKTETDLNRGGIDDALGSIHDFVERIITEPICTSQIFSSYDLDQLCLRIGRENFSFLSSSKDHFFRETNNSLTVIYLVSRLQRSGGHSRLIQDFIRLQPDKNHLVLSTEIGGPSDKDYFFDLFSKNDNVNFEFAPKGNFVDRLNWLQSTLLRYKVDCVYLLNHHQDSVAVAALVPELRLKGIFIHHGDHHLCLGIHLSHLIHFDLHPMGYHHCRNELGVNNYYLPLTFEDMQYKPLKSDFSQGGKLITATAARSNKIEIPYYVSYLDVIPHLLKITDGKHIHIGKLSPWGLRHLYKQMRKHGVPKDRFIYIEWTPSVWKTLQEYKVDVYIASFPYGAGLTLVEAMGAGIPVIMHEHMYSRVLSGLELAYPESFRWSNPDDLLQYLSKLTPQKLEQEKILARLRYETFHQPNVLKNFLQNPEIKELFKVPDLDKGFKPRNDEWAAWVESQLSFTKLLNRFAYRLFRAVRRVIN